MNIFRKKNLFWCLNIVFGFFFAVWSYRIARNQGLLYLKEYFMEEFDDFILIALIIPVYTILVILYTSEFIDYIKIIRFGNRTTWIKKLVRTNLFVSLRYVLIILFPMSIVFFLFSHDNRNSINLLYFFFTVLQDILIFHIFNYIVVFTKMIWNNDVLSIICTILFAFLPYVITRTFFRNNMITISDILTSRYLFDNENYLWVFHEIEVIGIFILCFISYKIMVYVIKNRDLLWGNHINES